MENKSQHVTISDEVLAAYLDGKATAEEIALVLDAMEHDPDLREDLMIALSVDSGMPSAEYEEILPIAALAATCGDEKLCCLECEKFILRRRGICFDEQEVEDKATRYQWKTSEGTALFNVGRILESCGLIVSRRYGCSIDDISEALAAGDDVIVAVDGGELSGDRYVEMMEDAVDGKIPDHIVVVLGYDGKSGTVTAYDPDSRNETDTYDLETFSDAWEDSHNYLVTANTKGNKSYVPYPLDLSDVKLDEDLDDLTEAIAENAHEVWAQARQEEGWTYGPERNDQLMQTPDMVPYAHLPESEKKYDREMAMRTIRLLKKLGYNIVKHKDIKK